MASYTPNYNLKKPADADTYDIADANGNMDLIDAALHSQNTAIASLRNGACTVLVNHTNSTAVDTEESFNSTINTLSFIIYPAGDMYGGVTQEHRRKTTGEYVVMMCDVSGTLFRVSYLIDWANNKVILKKNGLPTANWTSRIYVS